MVQIANKSERPSAKEVVVIDTGSVDSVLDEKQTKWHAISQYRAAVLWSAFVGLAGVNWGMDVLLSNGVISVPSFQEDFGYIYNGTYIISSGWQIAFNTASSIGGTFGAVGSGYLSDRLGKRWTLAIGCIVSIVAVFIEIFARRSAVLMAGKLINGLSLGVFVTIPSAYAAEICPLQIRSYTTSGVQLFISLGQLIANLILKGTGTLSSSLAYKVPFGLQFIFPVILLLGLPFAPESPWYLLRTRRPNTAKNMLSRLGYNEPSKVLSEMAETIILEEQKSSTSYLDCFRSCDLRRTEIACGIFCVAQLTGVVFAIGYSSYFFELAGLSASSSFSMSVGLSILGLVGVICSWFLIDRAGRRSTTIAGVSVLASILFIIGVLDVIPTSSTGPVYAQVVCLILFSFTFLFTIGPVSYTLFAEVSSPRLRSRTVGLGVVVQNLWGILMNIVVPLLINPDAANLGGKIGFIFGGTSLLGLGWAWLRVPETRGRNWVDLDWLFERGISAKMFANTVII